VKEKFNSFKDRNCKHGKATHKRSNGTTKETKLNASFKNL
jgi:hypothetical protein